MFPPGTTVNCFNITILDDSVIENPENFTIGLFVDQGHSGTSFAVVNIEDDDGMHY